MKNDSVTGKQNSKVQKKIKILFIAEGVSMAHPTRLFQLARSINLEKFEIHFATIPSAHQFIDFKSAQMNYYEIQSISNLEFNDRLFKTQFPFTIEELNQFAESDQILLDKIRPDIVVTDFRLSYKGLWKKNKIPWINLIQYHWHPAYRRPPIVPAVLPNKLFGRKIVELFAPFVEPLIMHRQMSVVNRFENQHHESISSNLFEFYCGGDHLFFPDLSEIYNLPQHVSNGTFIGPLIWKNSKITWPLHWPTYHWPNTESQQTAYVSLGSTGNQQLSSQIVDVLLQLEYRVYLSNSGTEKKTQFNDNVRQAAFLPSDLILQKCDLHICNGGTGTTYHSLSRGVPLFAVATNLDQCLHMSALKKSGLSEYIISDKFDSEVFQKSIAAIPSSKELKFQIMKTKQQIENYQINDVFENTIMRLI
ncbi:MAG: hypothetical protein JNM24_11895 [Bdellovibrionaceae bacterium]|jgi:UDP:flavonoid glycosyltransferase YjiC (YdhE family)|nr:hypothetical protein [Pseudobdellovibrionaceae bacterium]BFD69142.1 glycosyltransferase [Bdellovibrio sp. HAGR004]